MIVAWGFIVNGDGDRFDYATHTPEDLRLKCHPEQGPPRLALYRW